MFFKRAITYEDQNISLQLSRKWEKIENSDLTLLQFANSSENKQLSVSVLGINPPVSSSAELHQAVIDVFTVRIDAERKQINPENPIMDKGVTEAAGRSLGFFCGLQRESGRIFAGYIYGVGNVIVTLYLEGFGADPQEHTDCLLSIFHQLKIKNVA